MTAQLSANPLKWRDGDGVPLVLFNGSCKIRHIEFDRYTGAGDFVVLQDLNGKGEIILTGASDFESVRTGNVGYMTGLKIVTATLTTTGEVTVFFE